MSEDREPGDGPSANTRFRNYMLLLFAAAFVVWAVLRFVVNA
ncbi:MAG TPA: hypothetical protein VGB60_10400 [Brevundimonas sp.]|jgi:hypothetical protein